MKLQATHTVVVLCAFLIRTSLIGTDNYIYHTGNRLQITLLLLAVSQARSIIANEQKTVQLLCLVITVRYNGGYYASWLRPPRHNNRRTGLQASVGGARMHCIHACVGELILASSPGSPWVWLS